MDCLPLLLTAIGVGVGLRLIATLSGRQRARTKSTGPVSYGDNTAWMMMPTSDSGGNDCSAGDAGCDAGGGDGGGGGDG
jgi:hypothetical protein